MLPPHEFRAALLAVDPRERDAWVDQLLGLREVADDSSALPRDGVPYLPCAVSVVLSFVDAAKLGPDDVFVDVGAGVGRAAALVHRLTGARCLGVEIQPALARSELPGVTMINADASEHVPAEGTAFFLYCPFSGERLERFLSRLEPIARAHAVTLGCVDLPIPARSWLRSISSPTPELEVFVAGT